VGVRGQRTLPAREDLALSNVEIGERLYLTTRTVERHLSDLYTKLRLSGRSARAAAAARCSSG
jgi:DNA-binding NarL/FixJ family response regulator